MPTGWEACWRAVISSASAARVLLSPSGILVPDSACRAFFLRCTVSLPKPDLHIRISTEAKAALALLADVEQAPESVLAARLLEESILGKAHILKVAARHLRHLGLSGNEGEAHA